jgi:hypothetical protein
VRNQSRSSFKNQVRKIEKENEVFQVTVAMIHVALQSKGKIQDEMTKIESLHPNNLVGTDAIEVEVVPMNVTRAANAREMTNTATIKADAECKFY